MKLTHLFPAGGKRNEVIAVFGRARLVRRMDLGYELVGGTAEDIHDAREWISLFMHEVVLRHPGQAN